MLYSDILGFCKHTFYSNKYPECLDLQSTWDQIGAFPQTTVNVGNMMLVDPGASTVCA